MGLLMAETMLIDPLLDDGMPAQDTVATRLYAMDAVRHETGFEAVRQTSWPLPQLTPPYEMADV